MLENIKQKFCSNTGVQYHTYPTYPWKYIIDNIRKFVNEPVKQSMILLVFSKFVPL